MNETLPIFPLGLVLLPRMQLPLHIFEERYRLMVQDCIEGDIPFGIVYYNGSSLRSTGCTARIQKVLKQYDDGRADIMIEGTERFTLEGVDDSGPYLKGHVRIFDDCRTREATSESTRLQKEAAELFQRLALLNNRDLDVDFLLGLSPGDFSFLLSASDVFTLEEKQENLESSSTPNRLQNLITAARRIILRAEAQQKLFDILGDNTDIRHIFN